MALKQRRTEEKLLPRDPVPELCLHDRSLPRAVMHSCLQFLAVTDFPSLIISGRRGRGLFIDAMEQLRVARFNNCPRFVDDDRMAGLRWAIGVLRTYCRHLISIDFGPAPAGTSGHPRVKGLPADMEEALVAVIASNASSLTSIHPPSMACAPATAAALARCPNLSILSIDVKHSDEVKTASETVLAAIRQCPLVTEFEWDGSHLFRSRGLHLNILRSSTCLIF